MEGDDDYKDRDAAIIEAISSKAEPKQKITINTSSPAIPVNDITILDLLGENTLTPTTQGFKRECYDCGLQGGRTEGLIIFPTTNIAYCHSSGKWFKMLEAYALKKGIIRCLDGREAGDNVSKVLGGELWTQTLEELKAEFGSDIYNKVANQLHIRSSIELPGNNVLMSTFSDQLAAIYRTRNILFYRGESRDIVEIGRIKKINEEECYSETGFIPLSPNRFITLAEILISPWTTIFTKSGNVMTVSKSMNSTMATVVLASPNFQNELPIIQRIFDIQIPIIYQKQLTFPKKGYDIRFGSWLPFNAPKIDEHQFTLDKAKEIIYQIFEEFCFASEQDKIHAIAAFITPFLRGLLPRFCTRTPVFAYMANRERAGKDYCAGVTGILYEGNKTEEPPISSDEAHGNSSEEVRKKIMACMMQGKKRFHSSNNKGLINNAVFESVTTAEHYSDRILGRTEMITFANEMDYSFSANIGTKLTPDLANRCRVINLHLVEEDANARVFKNPNLHEWVKAHRADIISALYIIVKNWVDLGQPKGSVPFTSFPEWANICGGIMESSGMGSPCGRVKNMGVHIDSETEEMKLVFEACYDKKPDTFMSRDELIEILKGEDLLGYYNFNDRADTTKFGIKFEKFVNRELSGILMICDTITKRGSRRLLKFTKKDILNTPIKNKQKDDGFVTLGSLGNLGNHNACTPHEVKEMDIEKHIQENEKHILNSGSLGRVGSYSPTPTETLKDFIPERIRLPMLPRLPLQNNLDQISKEIEEYHKHKLKTSEKINKTKTDRELQFYEDPNIIALTTCTKEQTFDWIKSNPGVSFEDMCDYLGETALKWVLELVAELKIKPAGVEGYEII